MKLGISLLCEHPGRKTGLSSMFRHFVQESLGCYEDLEILLFCSNPDSLSLQSDRLTEATGYPANDRLTRRLVAEHFQIGPASKRLGCDILLTTGLVPVFSGMRSAMHLLTLHHLQAENRLGGIKSSYRKWACNHGVDHAHLVITNTKTACEQILSFAPDVAPKLLQSYEGICHNTFHSNPSVAESQILLERYGIDRPFFFWSSNFYPYKQAELMMEAWCALPMDLRDSHPLVLVGGSTWGDSMQRVIQIATKHGALGQIKMLGWVPDEDLPVLFRHAAVFVHSSREETFGRSVLESMASGVPCVVHSIPVMHEVTAGQALFVDFRKQEEASHALLRALTDPELRSKLKEGGIRRAADFSFRRLSVERIEALRRLAGKPETHWASQHPPCYADALTFPTSMSPQSEP